MKIWLSICIAALMGMLPNGLLASTQVSKQVVVSGLGACIARMAPQQSEKLMAVKPDSNEEQKFLQTLIDANASCLTRFSGFTMNGLHIRGAIAQALIIRDAVKAEKIASMLPLKVDRATANKDSQFLAAFAMCIVQSNPSKSLTLLKTANRTPDEQAAVLSLEPNLIACIPENVEYALNIPDLRSHIALAVYTLSDEIAGKVQ